MSNIQLVIFDKDGTLIDFHIMWGTWAMELARRLEFVTSLKVAEALYGMLGYDHASGRVRTDGPLASTPMLTLYDMTVELMEDLGLNPGEAESAVVTAWHIPDPVTTARPCADLPRLFETLTQRGIKVAVATTDDRVPSTATLTHLGLISLVDAMVCADDGVPPKPAPEMVWELCRATEIDPAHALVVGDSLADMQMARAAGAGRVVGVLTGVSTPDDLRPFADAVLDSIGDLIAWMDREAAGG